MKLTKTLTALVLCAALCVSAAGCNRRDEDGAGSSMADAADIVSNIESDLEDVESRVEADASTLEGEGEDEESEFELPDDSRAENEWDVDESIAAAMSTDFSEISALDAALVEWGSGGPTSANGRPNGATYYQELYGEYDAYFILPESDKIYLTFDEGYENGYTAQILDTLKEKDVKAVFFITLPYAKSEPELVTRMVEEGHILGNHSSAHKSFPSMPLTEAAKDVMELHDYVKAQFGYEMWLFRFPEGKFSEQTLGLLQSLGYKSIFWSFAYLDYDVNNQPLTIDALNTITTKSHPGAVYLLHAVSQSNAEVLDEVIDVLREQGYTLAKWDIY